MTTLNETHDPARKSWVQSANQADCDFPIQNLPFGVFRRKGEPPRGGVAIGDQIFDLRAGVAAGLFSGAALKAAEAGSGEVLNPLMALGNRSASDLLRGDGPERSRVEALAGELLVPMRDAEMLLPAHIPAFTDFNCSLHHSTSGRHGAAPRPQAPGLKDIPVSYNSRASSIVISGTPVRRPWGVYAGADGKTPVFGRTLRQDFEMEFAWFVGPGNELGSPISIDDAPDHIFGYLLLNDWSSRDIQRFETTLGPFLGKSLSTTISPWIVTPEALAPFRIPARIPELAKAVGDPPPLPPFVSNGDQAEGGVDVRMQVFLVTPKMRQENPKAEGACVCDTNFNIIYWTPAQMVTYHASNGCNLQTGDVMASGTVSGAADSSAACFSEQTVQGTVPYALPNGETRCWLEDGDEVIFRARASKPGHVAIGFGECRGRLDPAVAWPDRRG
jgi:fumarylacetoacetase